MSIAVALAPGCGAGGTSPVNAGDTVGSKEAPSAGEEEWAIRTLVLINVVREAHGLPSLMSDEAASRAAYRHGCDMDERDYFDHWSPEGEGPSQRLARQGIHHPHVGETLARGQSSPEAAVQAWMDSPPHRANILYPWWSRVGIAVHFGRSGGPWWVAEYFN